MMKMVATVAAALMMTGSAFAQSAVPPTASSPALDPAKLAIAADIVDVVLPPDQRDKIFASALDTMMRNMVAGALQGVGIADEIENNAELRGVFERFVERQRGLAMADLRAATPGLIEAYAHAYARMFSLDDLQAIQAFVRTPAGAHFVQRGSSILTDPDVAAWQRRLAAQGAARQQAELEKLKAELMTVRDRRPTKT